MDENSRWESIQRAIRRGDRDEARKLLRMASAEGSIEASRFLQWLENGGNASASQDSRRAEDPPPESVLKERPLHFRQPPTPDDFRTEPEGPPKFPVLSDSEFSEVTAPRAALGRDRNAPGKEEQRRRRRGDNIGFVGVLILIGLIGLAGHLALWGLLSMVEDSIGEEPPSQVSCGTDGPMSPGDVCTERQGSDLEAYSYEEALERQEYDWERSAFRGSQTFGTPVTLVVMASLGLLAIGISDRTKLGGLAFFLCTVTAPLLVVAAYVWELEQRHDIEGSPSWFGDSWTSENVPLAPLLMGAVVLAGTAIVAFRILAPNVYAKLE